MKNFNKLLVVLLSTSMIAGPAMAEGSLNLLVWEGYADQSFVAPFEAASGCKVSATYVGSNDDFLPKLQAGGGSVYDLLSVSADATPILIAAGLVDEIDTAQLPNYADVYERFRTDPSVSVDGVTYGVPLQWSANPFIYRTDKITTPPTSIAELWKPEYAGKVGMWDDKSSLFNTARMLGIANPFDMSDEELAQVRDKLIEQKPLIRKYWSTAGELTNLMASGEVYISYTWGGLILGELEKLGIPVAEFTPTEGADGWIDNWMLVAGTPNAECAYKYMDYMVSAEGQCAVANVTGYWPTNPKSATCLTPEQVTAMHVGDTEILKSLAMWQTPARPVEYADTWNAVKAAQ
jgi:putative spermidine/putrescine transport system substrate-binding protein/spermidine/putrescine transport system substrate-binding protein